MKSFRRFFNNLSSTELAYTTLGDSQLLLFSFRDFSVAWSHQEKFPEELRPHCTTLLEAIVLRKSDLDIWRAAAELLIAFNRITKPPKAPSPSSSQTDHLSTITDTAEAITSRLLGLRRNWVNPFFPTSLSALRNRIRGYEREPKKISNFYSKALVFVQSSGLGKSRLADVFGQSCPMINFVLRIGAAGFPPVDPEIVTFVRQPLPKENLETILDSPSAKNKPKEYAQSRAIFIWNHCLAVGLLQASFEICKFFDRIIMKATLMIF